jgi:ABC-type phosphate transport system substrate-binding protein
MMINKKIRVIVIGILATIWFTARTSLGFTDVVVIANKNNPVQTLKKSVLVRYFLKKTTSWDNGTRVVPIDLTVSDPVRQEFSEGILQKSPHEVEEYWIAESLTGGKSAPEIVSDSALVKKRVAADAGALGYVDKAQVDETVKVVETVN